MSTSTYSSMFDLSGRVAIVTGGARGIGLAIAEALGAWGAKPVLADLDADVGEQAVERLAKAGVGARFVPADVTSNAEVDALFDEVERREGGAAIVVNNAGISARIPAEDYPNEALDRMIAVNLKGVFHVMRAAARRWIRDGKGGRIVNMASFAGLVADPLSAPYAATKGAVVQLTRTCAVEWARHGISVNAIAPGYVLTDMNRHTLESPEGKAIIDARTAFGRPANPEEIAGATVYLASDAASYVTGHVLTVDGGWTAL